MSIIKTKIDNLNWFYHLDWREIQYAEQEGDYQNVVTTRGTIRIYMTMDKLIEQFPNLARIHRSYIVNPHQMLGYAVDTENQRVHVMFKDGTKLTIGRGRNFFEDFVEMFNVAKTRKDDNGNWI